MSPAEAYMQAAQERWRKIEEERYDWKEPWPKDKAEFKIVEESPPDKEGKQMLSLYWWDREGRRRGQVFRVRKEDLIAQAERSKARRQEEVG